MKVGRELGAEVEEQRIAFKRSPSANITRCNCLVEVSPSSATTRSVRTGCQAVEFGAVIAEISF